MRTFTATTLALTLLVVASSANAGGGPNVLGDKILDCTIGNQGDCANPSYPGFSFGVPGGTSDGIPNTDPPSHVIATIVDDQDDTPVAPGGTQYLQLDTTHGGGLTELSLFRADYVRDIGSEANALLTGNGGAGTMTHATVSVDINYNWAGTNQETFPCVAGDPSPCTKDIGFPHAGWETWIYVQSHDLTNAVPPNLGGPGGRVAGILINGFGGINEYSYGTVTQFIDGNDPTSSQNADWQNFRIEFDFAAQTVTYFLNDVEQFVDDYTDSPFRPFPLSPLDGSQGLTNLFILNAMSQPEPIGDPYPAQSNFVFVDNLFYSATFTGLPGPLGPGGGSTEMVFVDEDFESTGGLACDFNSSSTCDDVDIDLLAAAVRNGTSDAQFNVDGLGDPSIPDDADFDFYITDDSMLSTGFGDHDLNFVVNFNDFVKISNAFGSSGTGWDTGNGNTDDVTNFNDFVRMSNNFGMDFSSGSNVPEPAALLVLGVGALATTTVRRTR